MVKIVTSEDNSAETKYEVGPNIQHVHTFDQFKAHNSDVNGVAWKPNDSAMLFATVADDEYIKIWKVAR